MRKEFVICDICGKEIDSNFMKIKRVKYRESHRWFNNEYTATLECHHDCWKELCKVVKERLGNE